MTKQLTKTPRNLTILLILSLISSSAFLGVVLNNWKSVFFGQEWIPRTTYLYVSIGLYSLSLILITLSIISMYSWIKKSYS